MAHDAAFRDIEGVRFFSATKLFVQRDSVKIERRLQALLASGGVEFSESDCRVVTKPSIGVIAFGGFPLDWDEATPPDAVMLRVGSSVLMRPSDFAASVAEAAGLASAVTYLNPSNRDLRSLGRDVVAQGHLSPLHIPSWSILLLGISTACELELNCQRDRLQVSRLTAARSRAQNAPPIVKPDWANLDIGLVGSALDACERVAAKIRGQLLGKDGLEVGNAMFPLAKATIAILTGSARNFLSLAPQISDSGKEREYRDALATMVACISSYCD